MEQKLFKSLEAESRFMAAYDAVLALWPTSYESWHLPTRLGTTHVIVSGPPNASPLVLLHGFGVNATMWIPLIAALSNSYRIYALDTIGDLGKSKLTCRLTKHTDYVDWLEDVLHALQVETTSLIGFSQGGWIALNFAVHNSQMLNKLVLISPNAGLVPIRPEFLIRLMFMAIFPFAPLVEQWARWNSQAWDPEQTYYQLLSELTRAGIAGQNRFRSGVMPFTFGDAELQKITGSVLMLVGKQEVVNDPVASLKRAQEQIAKFEGASIDQARHMLPFDQPQQVSERILAFLEKNQ